MIKEWIDLGARWIGGCCQIFPPDIAEMVKVIKSYRKENDKIQQNKITVIYNYLQIIRKLHSNSLSCWNGYYFACHKGNNSCIKHIIIKH
jgi:hypothetical protein